MDSTTPDIVGLAAALGVGLLIGIERERSKGSGPQRQPGGLRPFPLFSLAGALAAAVNNPWLTPAIVLAAAAFATVAYQRSAEEPTISPTSPQNRYRAVPVLTRDLIPVAGLLFTTPQHCLFCV